MKYFKSITVALLLTFGLSGCYTQLQYSQKMKRVTDQESVDEYSWDGEEDAYPNEGEYDEGTAAVSEEYYDEQAYDENYVPVYYQDYETANYWADCRCNPYAYDRGYLDGFNDGRYNSYYSSSVRFRFGHRWYRSSWYHNSRYWFNYYYGPASPFRYYSYYDPFYYDPFFYNPYWYGYQPYYAFNFFYYNNSGYYNHNVRTTAPSRRYGVRTGGSSRVDNATRTRSRSGASRLENTSRTRNSSGAVRTRTAGTTRSRGTVNPGRTRSRGTGRVTPTRTRNSRGSEGSINRSRSGSRSSEGSRSRGNSVSRGDNESISRVGLIDTRRTSVPVRSLISDGPRKQDANILRKAEVRQPNRQQSSGSFWDRLKNTFKPSANRSFRNSSNSRSRSVRSQPIRSSSKPTIRTRSSSSSRSSGSSVKRSRSGSSSSGTRSRSSSSRGSSSRDRNNN